MKSFFQSLAYKNFFKFILSGAFYTGILSALAVGIGLAVEQSYHDLILALVVVFFSGALYGLILCSVGFLVNLLLLSSEKLKQWEKYLYSIIGLILGIIALVVFYKGKKLELTWWFLVFPGIPFLGCLYLFTDYSKKWISPLVTKE